MFLFLLFSQTQMFQTLGEVISGGRILTVSYQLPCIYQRIHQIFLFIKIMLNSCKRFSLFTSSPYLFIRLHRFLFFLSHFSINYKNNFVFLYVKLCVCGFVDWCFDFFLLLLLCFFWLFFFLCQLVRSYLTSSVCCIVNHKHTSYSSRTERG